MLDRLAVGEEGYTVSNIFQANTWAETKLRE
jgi:hypothetical protein